MKIINTNSGDCVSVLRTVYGYALKENKKPKDGVLTYEELWSFVKKYLVPFGINMELYKKYIVMADKNYDRMIGLKGTNLGLCQTSRHQGRSRLHARTLSVQKSVSVNIATDHYLSQKGSVLDSVSVSVA